MKSHINICIQALVTRVGLKMT